MTGTEPAPTLDEIRAAAERLEGRIERTPLTALGDDLHLKLENRQVAGSFKPRGALNASLRAAERGSVPGLVTYSSGNHGQAVALAGQLLSVPVTVVVPDDVRPFKRDAMAARGAQLVTCGRTSREREERALELARLEHLLLVPPYDHPDVVAGQGTVGLEIDAQAPELDAVVVPVGGGGLISGISLALAALRPGVALVGVEPRDADDARRSLEAGARLSNEQPSTSACDGLRNTRLGELNWRVIRGHVRAIVTVSDDEVLAARHELEDGGLGPVEPSGAATLAAWRAGRVGGALGVERARAVCVVSGGNSGPT